MKSYRSAAMLSIVAAALLIVGSCGTWVKAGSFSKNGLDADGAITLVLAILALIFAGLCLGAAGLARVARWFVLPLGLLSLLIAIIDVADVSSKAGNLPASVNAGVGWGLWLTLGAAILLCLGAVAQAIASPPKPAAPPPFPAQYPPQAQYPPAQYPSTSGQAPPPPPA